MSEDGRNDFSIALVDDEELIREGMRDRVDWIGHGFRLVGVYRDGRAALEALSNAPVDALITDIRMPRMDGIELVREVAQQSPETKILLLTGHDEFEYAQRAIQLQVWDFLLKPISAREMGDVLDRLRSALGDERALLEARHDLEAQFAAARPLALEQLLLELLIGSGPVEAVIRRLQEMNALPRSGRARVVLVSRDPGASEEPSWLRAASLRRGIEESIAVPLGALVCTLPDGEHALLALGEDADLFERLDSLRQAQADSSYGSVSIASGLAVGRLQDIRRSVDHAHRLYGERFLSGGNRLFQETDATERTVADTDGAFALAPAAAPITASTAHAVAAAIRHADGEAAARQISVLFERLKAEHVGRDVMILAMQRLLSAILDAADDVSLPVFLAASRGANPFLHLGQQTSLDAMQTWIQDGVATVCQTLRSRTQSQAETKMRVAVDAIRDRYADPDLGLALLCDELAMSTSSFSFHFKAQTGMTFVEALTERRIAEAKLLLQAGKARSSEIARAVGYRDPHYFSSAFKRGTGYTPTEYRHRVSSASNADGSRRQGPDAPDSPAGST